MLTMWEINMATDWSARTKAIAYFETVTKQLKRENDQDKALYEQALNALRRSQDHTAIQNRLKTATNLLRNVALCANEGSGLCQQCRDSIAQFVTPPVTRG